MIFAIDHLETIDGIAAHCAGCEPNFKTAIGSASHMENDKE